ncbi:DUF1127 domain-containing protein [Pontitalea aquivivens]|uniref:DUF1127 domain-containing protein n=1 Tax=Pontitalea aquivivens TaxID=3388663 RepID=UPI003970E093
MAMIQTETRPFNPVARLVSGLRIVVDVLMRARAAEVTLKELNRLSDRELRDIGLTRGDIPRIVAQTMDGR